MTRMITNPRQIFDEQGDARQRPEIGLVTLSQGACQQRGGHLLRLFDRQFGFRSRGALAGQGCLAAFIPRLFPAVSYLTGDAQPAGYVRGGNVLGEEFARLLAAFFHFGVVSRLSHAQR